MEKKKIVKNKKRFFLSILIAGGAWKVGRGRRVFDIGNWRELLSKPHQQSKDDEKKELVGAERFELPTL